MQIRKGTYKMNITKIRKQFEQGLSLAIEGTLNFEDAEELMQPYIDYKNATTVYKDHRTHKITFEAIMKQYMA
jgi:hypothetical protein